MSAKGFTPGPWKTELITHAALKKGSAVHFLTDAEGFNLGLLSSWVNEPDTAAEAEANARLIASAPTLLEALTLAASKPLAEHCTDEEWEFIRSALMAAQGEQA